MTAQTTMSRQEWEQKAILLHKVSQKLINDAVPHKCRVGFPVLSQIFQELVANYPEHTHQNIDALGNCYSGLFFVAWRGCEELDTLVPFAKHVAQPFGRLLQTHNKPKEQHAFGLSESETGALKLAYVTCATRLFGGNGVARATYSLLAGHAALNKSGRKPIVYCLVKPDQDYLNALAAIDLDIVDLSDSQSLIERADAVVDHARKEGIQALICDDPGPIQTMIFSQRAAPIQALADMGFAPLGDRRCRHLPCRGFP